ncbi:MAG: class I SAM-dependent methyltransferase [Anaerolineales bacterium]|nr:class I SAM-dependent methyltransferase [Anaerolineales bacterium]MCW5855342.1 class I SAM-dependent methyltransferase [Anaerolineales bacterium]
MIKLKLISPAGLFFYLLRRNDKVWGSLSPTEKELILQNNSRHNQERPTYANPALYKGGASYDSVDPEPLDLKTQSFKEFLQDIAPTSVLEIGPGSGQLTKYIVQTPSVEKYTAVDINKAFLDYLQPRLAKAQKDKPEFSYKLLAGDINEIDLGTEKYDAIVFLSAVHHIPDRLRLFSLLSSLLKDDGRIYTQEPAHYIPRQLYLFKKFMRTYRHKGYWSNSENYGTHHFCTIEEFEEIASRLDHLEISSCYFFRINFPFPNLIKKILVKGLLAFGKHPELDGTFSTHSRKSLLHYFADEIIVQFHRPSKL